MLRLRAIRRCFSCPWIQIQETAMSENPSAYGYAWAEWLAKEDPEYMKVRQPLGEYSTGDGKALAIKYREMVMIGILAFRGRPEGVVAHMRRAVAHGATKRNGAAHMGDDA